MGEISYTGESNLSYRTLSMFRGVMVFGICTTTLFWHVSMKPISIYRCHFIRYTEVNLLQANSPAKNSVFVKVIMFSLCCSEVVIQVVIILEERPFLAIT